MTPDGSIDDSRFPKTNDASRSSVDLVDQDHARTSLVSPENAHSSPGNNKFDQTVLDGRLDSSKGDGVGPWLQWWPVAVFPPAYALHSYYRRHRPRRLPPLTPLKLPGIYGLGFTSTMLFVQQAVAYTETVIGDKRLHIIDLAGDRATGLADDPEGQKVLNLFTVETGLAQVFKRISEESYYSSGIVGKLAWWDRHLWSSQEMFDKWTLMLLNTLDEQQSVAALPREDLEICATHLANRSSTRLEQISSAIWWSMGFSVPLAMLARWSGRRALYLPMNGLQRLLIGAWMYVDVPMTFRELWYLRRIREKDVAAQMMVDLFGSFDEEFEELGIEYDSPQDES